MTKTGKDETVSGVISKGWAGLGLLIMLGIYLLAVVGRPVVEFLSTNNALKPLMAAAVIFCFGLLILGSRWMGEIGKIQLALAAGVFIVSQILSFTFTRTIAEAVHTIEYELLAICIYNALRPKYSGSMLSIYTLFLILIAGWSDESVQYMVPDRYYDHFDVLLNLVSGAFGLAIAIILHKGRIEAPQ